MGGGGGTTRKRKKKEEANVPGSHLGEISFDGRPRDETDVFPLRSTIRFPISLTDRRAVGNASLREMTRNEGAGLLHRQCRPLHAGKTALIGRYSSSFALVGQTLELIRSD